MERVLEPEIMNDEQQALAYAKADFSTSNQWYVDHLLADYPDKLGNIRHRLRSRRCDAAAGVCASRRAHYRNRRFERDD